MACQRVSLLLTATGAALPRAVLQQHRRLATSALVAQKQNQQVNANMSTSAADGGKKYKIVVVGGGSGGCAVAAKFSGEGKNLAVIEPSESHYYQPMWTLVGAGLKTLGQSEDSMSNVLPSGCDWIKDKVTTFNPDSNTVTLGNGNKVQYDYLVVAMGIQLDYDKVTGLISALQKDPRVASNYHSEYVTKTFPALNAFKGGNAIFTFPNTPIKCAGAPQKIMYLADEIFNKNGVRDKTKVIFNTSLGVIFGVKKYADALLKVVADRGIQVNYKHNLTEIDHANSRAVFKNLDTDKTVDVKYDFMHVTPPMSSPDVLKKSPLVNEAGWVDVHKHTLQHTKYGNVFAVGDCSSLPTSKTAAAIASQSGIVHKNLSAVMKGESTTPLYDGYTSCPLVTSSKTCILAEFDYDAQPLETLPWNQAKERRSSYIMKAHFMPHLYWQGFLKGYWNGPKVVRKILHLGQGK